MLTPEAYLKKVKSIFLENGDPERAIGQMRYLRNQFSFYGLKAPEWVALSKTIFQEMGIPEGTGLKALVRLCFEDEYREIQFFSVQMVESVLKKQPPEFIDFLEEMICTKSWWDTVDWLAKLTGIHFKKYPELIVPVTGKWMDSGNIWLQRVAIIFQLLYRDRTNAGLMFGYILRIRHSKEFFLQKGAGWALRQYSKTNPEAVLHFIQTNRLPSLTHREGLKWMKNQGMI